MSTTAKTPGQKTEKQTMSNTKKITKRMSAVEVKALFTAVATDIVKLFDEAYRRPDKKASARVHCLALANYLRQEGVLDRMIYLADWTEDQSIAG
jgi:hypothetical protein